MTASRAGASPVWPAVTWMDRGRARLSLAKWAFVLNPTARTSERVILWLGPAGRPLFLAPAECW